MTYPEFARLLSSDQYRYGGSSGVRDFLKQYRLEPGFRFSVWMRLTAYLCKHWLRWAGVYHMARWLHLRLSLKYGFDIDFTTRIGPGLYLPHYGGIVVNRRCVIGANCNLSHQVTIGIANRGDFMGCPVIGDRIYIGPGAKIFGSITIGDDAAIGANAVVTRNVPANAVAAGVPARVISMKGSQGYVNQLAANA